MTDEDFFRSVQELVDKVLTAETNNFFELAEIANLDPSEDFAGGNLKGVKLNDTNLRDFDFSDTDFSDANLNRVNLVNANLRRANLSNANLSKADLSGADLSGANLTGANLVSACLEHANLSNSRANNANFSSARFTGACLEGWLIDRTTRLDGVICDYVYLIEKQQERCPSVGTFVPDEFGKFAHKNLNKAEPDYKEIRQPDRSSIHLIQWLENNYTDAIRVGWQMIGVLLDPEQEELAFAIRSTARFQKDGVKRTKLIDLGTQAVVLLIALTSVANEEVQVLAQVHPTRGKKFVPSDLKVALLDESGITIQEVQSRDRDNYIQLKRFTCPLGERFAVYIKFGDVDLEENFEL
jgi:uncharacterized protein YjbI with pentapeptide repeats